jgi:protein TonB
MAPREINLPEFPDTLPEDFAEWDSGEQSRGKQPPVENARVEETRASAVTRTLTPDREADRSAPPAVVRTAKPAVKTEKADVDRSWKPPVDTRPPAKAAKPEYAPASSQRSAEAKLAEALWPDAEPKKKAKREPGEGGHRTLVIAVAAVVVCAGLGAGYMLYSWRSHPAQHPSTVANANPGQTTGSPDTKPDPRNTLPGGNGSSAAPSSTAQSPAAQNSPSSTATQPAADTTPAANTQQNPTPNVNMDQFTSSSRIPRNQQGGSAPEPVANLDASHMAGGNGGPTPVFNSSSKQHVQFAPAKPVDVAPGASSLSVVKRTMPEYPQIARNMHVSGVVTVAITVTPEGAVSDARAISGPVLLRQSAVDAVRNWRFKPYLVNNRAVPVQTNVNVDFALQ